MTVPELSSCGHLLLLEAIGCEGVNLSKSSVVGVYVGGGGED